MSTANEDMAHSWRARAPQGRASQQRQETMFAPFGARLLEVAAPTPPEVALDVGCGAGDTTLALGGLLCPDGAVVAADIAAAMAAYTLQRAEAAGLTCVEAVEADAQVHDFGAGRFDLVVSRFGMMFFGDPAAAF